MAAAGVASAAAVGAGRGRAGRRVAIVGGGPAGMAACRFLLEAGHQPTVFEAGRAFGGIWAPEPINPVVYKNLRTNIPKVLMQSFDLDFPEELPSYIRGEELGDYFRTYASHFDLARFVRFGTRVTRVSPLATEEQDAAGASAWTVDWKDGDEAGSSELDAVIVANGHYEVPYQPTIPGQDAWLAAAPCPESRRVMHSCRYGSPEGFAGRVVLVVGGRSSAVDIARELREVARWVYVMEKGCKEASSVGNCAHVPMGSRVREDGQLADGEAIQGPPVEDLILATGYEYSFPFLDSGELGLDFGSCNRFVAPLYQHVVHARRPSLCFIGIPLSVPAPIALFEAQARLAAATLSGTALGAASTAEREAWVESRRQAVGERSQDLHFLAGAAWSHMRELARLAGLEGDGLEAYARRLAVLEQIHGDRRQKSPDMPWGEDWYRNCEYSVDWPAGTWTCTVPVEAPAAVNL